MPRVCIIGLQKGPKWEDVEAAVQQAGASILELGINPEGITVYPIATVLPVNHLPVQVEIRLVKRPERKRELLVQMNTAIKLAVQSISQRPVVSELRVLDELEEIIDYTPPQE